MRIRFRLGVAVFVCLCGLGFQGVAQGAAKTTISPSFITKVNAYCSAEESRFNKALGTFPYPNFDPTHPDKKTMLLVGQYFEKALPLRNALPSGLKKLGEPQEGKNLWDALRSLVAQFNHIAITQTRVALAGNTKAFVTTVNETQSVQNKLGPAAHRGGFAESTPCRVVF